MSPSLNCISETNYQFPNQTHFYKGKVRDVYSIGDLLVMVASDRISAFDHVLPRAIPYKGQVLNQIAAHFLNATADIVPNWLVATPDSNVTVGKRCVPFKVEMVVRGYLVGHAWRIYKSGGRMICGVEMPEGMKEGQKFPTPIITPTTKADKGHDEDISREDILAQGIVSEVDYKILEDYTILLFTRGTQMAKKQGLILVDTKYEFGKLGDEIILIDEIHTPDSSRFFYLEGYTERLKSDEPQRQLSKEFVHEWLMDHGFQGLEGQMMPEMPNSFVNMVSDRYIELFELITGNKFIKYDNDDIERRIEKSVVDFLINR